MYEECKEYKEYEEYKEYKNYMFFLAYDKNVPYIKNCKN